MKKPNFDDFNTFELKYEIAGKELSELDRKVIKGSYLVAAMAYVEQQPDTPDKQVVMRYIENMLWEMRDET